MYDPPKFKHNITLRLNSNESRCAIDDLDLQLSQMGTPFVTRYPSHIELQKLIGQWIGVDPDRIVVTAGGDDSIDRVMRHSLVGDRKKIVSHMPSFEMIQVYANTYSGRLDTATWIDGEFPLKEFVSRIDDATGIVVVVSPNNPTGGLIPVDQILELSRLAKKSGCKLLVDNAYIEFADDDPTQKLIGDENLMIVRTFSKAWGLAGMRVGYLIAPDAQYAKTIRNLCGPYPVSAVSLETARRALAEYHDQMVENVALIRKLRTLMSDLISDCGGKPFPSSGNFVLAEFEDAEKVWSGLAEDGVGVRKFVGSDLLTNRLRITCPATPSEFLHLAQSMCRVGEGDFEQQKNALSASIGQLESETTDLDSTLPELSTDSGDRTATVNRETKETKIDLILNLDGTGKTDIETGIGFLDHMLTALAFHSRIDLSLKCIGDLHVDDHHTAEDCALALGTAIDQALGKRTGIKRFGFAYAPLDEALARTVIDLSGRPWPEIHLQLEREMVGQWATENVTHFFQSLAMTLKCSLHVDVIRGTNDHHRVEAAFKSLAKAIGHAVTRTAGAVPSTKGVL